MNETEPIFDPNPTAHNGETSATCSQLRPTPESDAVIGNDSGDSGYIFNLAQLARRLERERDAALDREAAIRHFCEVEMSWEFFRAEFSIGDAPNKSLQNAKKLKEFLAANA